MTCEEQLQKDLQCQEPEFRKILVSLPCRQVHEFPCAANTCLFSVVLIVVLFRYIAHHVTTPRTFHSKCAPSVNDQWAVQSHVGSLASLTSASIVMETPRLHGSGEQRPWPPALASRRWKPAPRACPRISAGVNGHLGPRRMMENL